MNNRRRGYVTCYKEEFQLSRSFGEGQDELYAYYNRIAAGYSFSLSFIPQVEATAPAVSRGEAAGNVLAIKPSSPT